MAAADISSFRPILIRIREACGHTDSADAVNDGLPCFKCRRGEPRGPGAIGRPGGRSERYQLKPLIGLIEKVERPKGSEGG